MKIVVLAGGLSPERDVSLSSGALIANALMESGYEVMLLDLFFGTDSRDFPPVYHSHKDSVQFSYQIPSAAPDLEAIRAESKTPHSLIGPGVLEICREADSVFLALHGSIGENGQLQAVLDTHGIRYTGTGYTGSLLAMDKDLSKTLMRANGVSTPDWRLVRLSGPQDFSWVPYPCVVKPCSCGSSVGVSMADTPKELEAALDAARKYEDMVLIEEKITGREFSVGILNGKALPVIEIRPLSGFYDYENKYQQGMTEEICPAQISVSLRELLQAQAEKVHQILRLGFYSRVDFLVDEQGRPYCLEANTLPGMTPQSLLPQEAAAQGISYRELCERIAFSK